MPGSSIHAPPFSRPDVDLEKDIKLDDDVVGVVVVVVAVAVLVLVPLLVVLLQRIQLPSVVFEKKHIY